MLEKYFQSPFTLEQLRNGPSEPWIEGFARFLHDIGYSWWTARAFLRAAHHLGHFLHKRDIAFAAVQPCTVDEFQLHLRHCRCPRPRGAKTETVRGARCFLRYLRTSGIVAQPTIQPMLPVVQGFGHWLRQHRGASETTVSRYGAAAGELITELGDDTGQYNAERLRRFLLNRARRRGVGGTKAILSAVRMFLRYLATEGKCAPGLDAAIPAIAGSRLASLPRCLSAEEVEQLLAACNLTSPIGVRDRAVILLLARLGLRAGDVAALRIADINWDDGGVLVKGKNRRQARLPLPQEVGDAILAYLQYRPRVDDDRVFIRAIAPFTALAGPCVSQIVRRNMRRAGINAPAYGSHILRHTAATQMLRQGVSLYDIGSVLRHCSADMSAYYAKVDMGLLKQVVQPWPEVLSC
jgi:site-specific recombinase XerD